MPLITVPELARHLRISANRAYILTRQDWFPREIFLGRILMDEAAVKAALRKRFFRAPVPVVDGLPDHHLLLTIAEAATHLGCSASTIRRLMAQRRLGSYRMGKPLIPESEILRLIPTMTAYGISAKAR